MYNWKLFEYVQFCNERFANRSRRWVGLDNTINEELPPDLRSMDQMCLSTQFYLLGSLHASGIVMSVLGYMLVLHQNHNLFGDPMIIPLFAAVTGATPHVTHATSAHSPRPLRLGGRHTSAHVPCAHVPCACPA
jgi:hypothetical protein